MSYFETSAKEGWGIRELSSAIRDAIDWAALPQVSSNYLFQRIKAYLVAEKVAGRRLASVDDLYRGMQKTKADLHDSDDLRAQFSTCVRLVENRGLIRYLSFGGLVLLQPELLDSYASAMVNAAKEQPDGLGCIAESEARAGAFPMPKGERPLNKDQEALLLIATIEDMLRHEIALREQGDGGPYLVFPTQFTRDWEKAPNPPGRAVVFSFEGPVLNVYATLAVRLSHSGLFQKAQMWCNAATYSAPHGGTCGIFLHEFREGQGQLTVFHNGAVNEDRNIFEDFIYSHLRVKTLPETLSIRRIIVCSRCGEPVPERTVELRRRRKLDWVECDGCNARVPLIDDAAIVTASSSLKMSIKADLERDRGCRLRTRR